MRRVVPLPLLTLAVTFWVGAGPGLLTAGAAPQGNRRAPALLSGRGEARIALGSGERVVFPLPAGAELTAVAGAGGRWFAAGTRPVNGAESRREILLVSERGGVAVPLPPPAGNGARLRQEPLPVTVGDRLAGLVWLEGEDSGRFAVRYAAWNGEGWGETETVSGRGPGSQVGLAAAHLADGSLVLAWSAFDGEDNEILWARRSPKGAWSRPLRLAADNEVPDLLPALLPSGDGALLAWNRYDGEGYEVVTARLRGGAWSAPRPAAPSGSVFPTLEPAAGGGARLLYRTAIPGGWGLAQLDAAGRALRRATITDVADVADAADVANAAGSDRERPIAVTGPDGVRFRWEGRAVRERVAPWQAPPGATPR